MWSWCTVVEVGSPLKEINRRKSTCSGNTGRVLDRGQLIDRVGELIYVGHGDSRRGARQALRSKIEPDPAAPAINLITGAGLRISWKPDTAPPG